MTLLVDLQPAHILSATVELFLTITIREALEPLEAQGVKALAIHMSWPNPLLLDDQVVAISSVKGFDGVGCNIDYCWFLSLLHPFSVIFLVTTIGIPCESSQK